MKPNFDFYKQFVDDLVSIRPCVYVRWVNGNGWPKVDENKKINQFISSLNASEKEILSRLLQSSRDGGIHDVLAYLHEEMDNGLLMKKGNIEFPYEPFGTELHYDWTCRYNGDEWPSSDK